MGGDHKCPVCQATFTRPQHVARHMRSHTGDRPYKCQYCGDQFARSDLLSRHVNKCHANEKPLPATGNTRRKGSASASRATTSKQACDQCVQSSLPCDGCNPCSKCTQRKCRCTYVKFHRQTAPAGPGHNTRPPIVPGSALPNSLLAMQTSAAAASRVPMFSQHPHPDDEFLLGPPPPTSASASTSAGGGPTTMAETLYNSNSFAFPALYPTSSNGPAGEGLGSAEAVSYRAQAQAELFGPGRSGLGTGLTPLFDPRGGSSASTGGAGWLGWDNQPAPAPPSSSSALAGQVDDGYHHHQQQHGHARHHHHPVPQHSDMIPASSSSSSSIAGSTMHDKQPQHALQHHRAQGSGQAQAQAQATDQAPGQGAQQQQQQHYMAISMPYPMSGGIYSSRGIPNTSTGTIATNEGSNSTGSSDRAGSEPFDHRQHHNQGDRRGSIDAEYDYEYEYEYERYHAGGGGGGGGGAGSDGSHSVPSSAASSSVHLPLPLPLGMGVGGGVGGMGLGVVQQQHQQYLMQQQQQVQQQQQQRQQHRQQQAQQQQAMFNAGYNMGMMPDRSATASTSSSSSSQHHRGNYSTDATSVGYVPHDERQEFSSAFGLMSLDDPNVMAGLAVDGQPFFSNPDHAHNQQDRSSHSHSGTGGSSILGQDMDTPMPMKQEATMLQLPMLEKGTPSRESDTRELREFWKQYMRTPLSGPGPANGMGLLGESTTTTATTSSKGMLTSVSSVPFRRPRVASLPSAKTPVTEREAMYPDLQEEDGRNHGKLGPMSSLRTTLHGNHEDLRSYEAAVLARKAPTTLNLQIKKPMKPKGGVMPSANYGTRPRSAVDNASSSLANAFGGSGQAQQQQKVLPPPSVPAGRVTFAVKREPSSSPSIMSQSRATSSAVEDSDNSSNPDQDSSRPSFKRLPSQTLGPANAKRAFLGSSSSEREHEDLKDRQLVGWGTAAVTLMGPSSSEAPAGAGDPPLSKNDHHLVLLPAISHPDRVVASLSDRRRRRMSAPTTTGGVAAAAATSGSNQPPPPPLSHAAHDQERKEAPATRAS